MRKVILLILIFIVAMWFIPSGGDNVIKVKNMYYKIGYIADVQACNDVNCKVIVKSGGKIHTTLISRQETAIGARVYNECLNVGGVDKCLDYWSREVGENYLRGGEGY